MKTLVRRFAAAERRLEAWRHANGSARAAAAAQRRQRRHAAVAVLNDEGAEEMTWSTAGSGASHMASSSSDLTAVLRRSAVVRAVQAWWRTTRGNAAVTTSTAAAGKRAARSTHAQPRRAAVPPSPLPFAWIGTTGRHLLRRVLRSLTSLSSERGQPSRVELLTGVGSGRHPVASGDVHARGSSSDGGSFDEESGEDGAEGGSALYHHLDAESSVSVSGMSVQRGAARPACSFPSPLATDVNSGEGSESSHSSHSSSSSSDNGDGDAAAPPVVSTSGEDSRFTLSWIRGLRGDRSGSHAPAAAAATAASTQTRSLADESFRGASRLLTKSRARFSRWLQRQRRLQSAKRALLRERWLRFSPQQQLRGHSGHIKGEDADMPVTTSLGGVRGGSEVQPAGFCAAQQSSLFERAILQCVPSAWERTVNTTTASGSGASVPAASAAAARAEVRSELRRVVAAVMAARAAQSKDEAERSTASRSPTRPPTASNPPAASRAERQDREHAAAAAQLGRSITALARLRRGGASAVEEGEEKEGASLLSTVVLSPRPSASLARLQLSSNISSASATRRATAADTTTSSPVEDPAHSARSLLVDPTHTPRDAAVRLAYEEVMRDVCGAELRQAVNTIATVSHDAADRALAQWVERQLLMELASSLSRQTTNAEDSSKSADVLFTGILRHIQSRVPVSLSALRLDDADRRALAAVQEKRESDAVAAALATAGYTITYRQLASLSADSWLNDQVINNYLQLLCEDVESRQQQQQQGKQAASRVPHSVASMGTHFYAKVESELASGAEGLHVGGSAASAAALPPLAANSATLRWLRRRQHLLEPFNAGNAQSVRAVLIPVNIEGQHWALAVYYRDEKRWVLYDSMSRSDRARQRGELILSRLSHTWRECQRHYNLPIDAVVSTQGAVQRGDGGVAVIVAAAYTPFSARETSAAAVARCASPLDTLQPYGSMAELHRAAKRLRHQEAQLEEEKEGEGEGVERRRLPRAERAHDTSSAPLAATTLPASLLSDAEVEWFTDGFRHAPQQRNGNDCGVFVCQVAWCVAQGIAVSFTQADVTLLRHVVTLELLSKRLLRRYPTNHTSSSADV